MSISDSLFKKAYENLKTIGDKSFTPREIDVVSCVLSGKGEKAIASILSISPRGVESHTRNIRQKIGCVGRDGIIEFVEKNHKVEDFRRLYRALLEKSKFIEILKRVNATFPTKNINCKIFFDKEIKDDSAFAKQLKEQLKVVGIEASLARGDYVGESETCIFIGTSERFLHLRKPKSENKDIYAVLNVEQPPKGFPADRCVVFENKGHDYLHFFSLLEKLMPDVSFSPFIEEFKVFYKKEKPVSNIKESGQEAGKSPLKADLKKTLLGKTGWAILLVVFLILVVFFSTMGREKIGLTASTPKKVEKKAVTWNPPLLPSPYIKRDQQIKTIWEKLRNPLNKMVGIFGLGGVGKTFLAIDYFHDPKEVYDFKAWFNAESPSLIKASYIKLGEKHNLFSARMSEELKINEVKQWIENRGKVLLVYDNAPNMEAVEQFIPQNVQVIITSRNYKVPNSIKIGVMSKQEALKLLKSNLPEHTKKEKNFIQDAKKLIKILNYIPLAISQAAAYITETMVPLSKYLSLYATERNNLLSSDIMPLGSKHEPIYVTWDLSLDAIKQEPKGKQIIELLNFISFCHEKNIPKSLLTHLLFDKVDNKTEIEFNKLIGVLRQYSLVNVEENNLTIHQLVSHWIRDKVKKKDRPYYISKLKKTIENIYPKDFKKLFSSFSDVPREKIHMIHSFIPHIEEVLRKEHHLESAKEKIELYILAADAYYAASSLEKSKKLLLKLLTLKKKNREGASIIAAERVLYNLAFIYERQGDYIEARKLLEEALLIYRQKYGERSLESLEALKLLSTVYHVLGNYKKRAKILEKAIFINEKFYGKDSPETGVLQRLISTNHHLLGEFKEARDFLKKSLANIQKNYGKGSAKTAPMLNSLGWLDFFMGKRKLGQKTMEQAADIFSKYKNQEDVRIATYKIFSGLLQYETGCFDKSVEDFLKAVQIREKYHGDTHIWTAFSQVNLAMAYVAVGEKEKARGLLRKALKTVDITTKKMLLWSSFLTSRVGTVYQMLGESDIAISLMTRSLRHIDEKYGKNNIFSAIVSANLGSAYVSIGQYEKGREFLEKALGVIKEKLGPEHLFVGKILLNMSLSYISDFKKKKKMKKEALQILNKYYGSSCKHGSAIGDYNLILPF